VSKIDTSDEGYNIIKIIINLASTLGMTVIAEGIETQRQLELLKKLGCHYGQGYYFSKAIKAQHVPEFIHQKLNTKMEK
jgi:EAL domain-containing protein (putative c-di-GMP-specific phosphodiesterase class I)